MQDVAIALENRPGALADMGAALGRANAAAGLACGPALRCAMRASLS
jgi:hypothetical protein